MACPVRPPGIISEFWADGLVDPRADSTTGVFKRRTEFANHQSVRNKVQRKHQDPAEDNLNTVEVHVAVDDVTETPHGGERHKGQVIPKNLLCLHKYLL